MREDSSATPLASTKSSLKAKTKAKKRKAEKIKNDPLGTQIYTLDNGLKVYFSHRPDQPRIQTYIAFRAGSKNDPPDTTGLAHYMEHMLFKGTDEIGTVNWKEEKKLLEEIAELYEAHRQTTSQKKKDKIYKQIDELSQEAASYAVPNEYDKLVSTLGAKGTNAYTSHEKTVYLNDIPANELEKWCAVESRRFKKLVLRQFHTELETVFEEYNRAWDNDYRKSWVSIYESLYKKHPYRIPIIGKPEHLKNPSMRNIEEFFYQFYRPNNCAIVLSGDVDPKRDLAVIENYFGDWEKGKIPVTDFPKEEEITKKIVTENMGSQAAHVYIAFRLPGANSNKEMLTMKLLAAILQNGQAGLFDLNLMQGQKLLDAHSFETVMSDYSQHILFGLPKEGQSLEEVQDLLLGELEKVKNGDFGEWLMEAVITDLRFQRMKSFESNTGRGNFLVSHFTLGTDLETHLATFDQMEKITKKELIAFTKKHYKENYAVTFKRHGEDKTNKKVSKPPITPFEINRAKKSAFFGEFEKWSSERLKPQFAKPEEILETGYFANTGRRWSYAKNKENKSFKLYLNFPMGNEMNKQLRLLSSYFPYFGTNTKTPAEVQKTLFRLGLSMNLVVKKRRSYLMLTGLEKSFDKGVDLILEVLRDAVVSKETLQEMVTDILKTREDRKMDKDHILRTAMINHALYGENSPYQFNNTAQELLSFKPSDISKSCKDLLDYSFELYYYGSKSSKEIYRPLLKLNTVIKKKAAKRKSFKISAEKKNKVFFFHYEQKQVEIVMIRKQYGFNDDLLPYHHLFNQYFGAGLSSIIFQEIREAQALAYSAYAYVGKPSYADEPHLLQAYIGTQTDKLAEATGSLLRLMSNMPHAKQQFEASKLSALKSIENERKSNQQIYWMQQSWKNLGITKNPNKAIYQQLQDISLDDLADFFSKHISNKPFSFLVLGRKEDLDMKLLKSLGEFTELNPQKIFLK